MLGTVLHDIYSDRVLFFIFHAGGSSLSAPRYVRGHSGVMLGVGADWARLNTTGPSKGREPVETFCLPCSVTVCPAARASSSSHSANC